MIDLLSLKRSTLPMGNRRYGGGGGGDGGYADRQVAMKSDQDLAIQQINAIFGKGEGAPIYETRIGMQPRQVGNGDGGYYTDTAPYEYQELIGHDTAGRDKAAADRTALYSTITQDSSARLLDKLSRDRDIAQRGTNFQLARQGLAGGSADVDQGRQLLEKFQEGSIEAGNAALAAGNEARSADEKTRVNLINNIRQGMAGSDALSASYAALDNNAKEARDAAMSTNIGGFFDDINALNQQRQYQQGVQAAQGRFGSGGGISTSGNSGGNSGRITR